MLPWPYRAELTCRRCGAIYTVCKMADAIRYWYCHRREDGTRCDTFNRGR